MEIELSPAAWVVLYFLALAWVGGFVMVWRRVQGPLISKLLLIVLWPLVALEMDNRH